ncbi:hypothetical protein JAAARDRAFT_157067 [Jaapia argillacea MUCL 33604]|uniref:Zn(2)-C6 fungal-type domain-containing protein n=1 Tax=Jaapia argillacea MUCL 33604 TaxID=933084 RepID=A0A067Q360_9AGAM|nr:hypothetical protein JAAARDRAFT_157067 [Jaapia argillacea MUCL 33604]
MSRPPSLGPIMISLYCTCHYYYMGATASLPLNSSFRFIAADQTLQHSGAFSNPCFRPLVLYVSDSPLRPTFRCDVFSVARTCCILHSCSTMPADTSKPPGSQRTSKRLMISEEDLAIKRARGEVSCAECRRLKLKCDKKLPCSSCDRRGCPNICPNGTLSAGQGSRFILADTRDLHRKITDMSQRIRQLEDALAVLQASVSSDRHPLLSDSLLGIKFWPEREEQRDERGGPDEAAEAIDAFGTLTVSDSGEVKYFGRSAGSEALLVASAEWEGTSHQSDDVSLTSEEISRISDVFPFDTSAAVDNAFQILDSALPPQPRAWTLCETYFEHASWFYSSVRRDEVVNDIMAPIYKWVKDKERMKLSECYVAQGCPHKLAVLYMVFALGALMDLTLPPQNAEAEEYYRLGRAALALRSVVDSPSIEAVQALALMGAYHSLAGKRYTMDSSWSMMSISAKLAQSIGLHRDCARWGLDAKTVQRRRAVFWSVFTADVILSMLTGRPHSTPLAYIDCELPTDAEQSLNDEGKVEPGYAAWKDRMAKEILAPLCEQMLTARPPNYEALLELDRKVRQTPLPNSFKLYLEPEDEDYRRPSVCMRGYLAGNYRMMTMLFIHRSFFAQALLDHPLNPFRSPYAPSYLAAYRCAAIVIKSSIHYFERCPHLIIRFATFWTHVFSASVIVGFVVTRTPTSSIAPSAFAELKLAVELFEKGAIHNFRAQKALVVLTRLKERAERAFAEAVATQPSALAPRLAPTSVHGSQDDRDELALFGGQTLVLPTKVMSKSLSSRQRQPSNSPSPPGMTAQQVPPPAGPPSPTPVANLDPAMQPFANFPADTFMEGLQGIDLSSFDLSSMGWADPPFAPGALIRERSSPPRPAQQNQGSQIFNGGNNPPLNDMGEAGMGSYYGYPASADLSYLGLGPGEAAVDSQWLSLLQGSGIFGNS